MTYVLGVNCHIILEHPDVNAGQPYGFVCSLDGTVREGGVQIIREVKTYDPDDPDPKLGTDVFINFDVVCADNLRDPNGTARSESRSNDYAAITQYLAKSSGVNITTPIGQFLNYGAWGWCADERHTPNKSTIKCQFDNTGYYVPPADPTRVLWSCWWEITGDPGDLILPQVLLSWNSSYWR